MSSRLIGIVFCILIFFALPVIGADSPFELPQKPGAFPDMGEVTAEPLCFQVINQASYKVYGAIATDYYLTPDGSKARHRANFALEPKATQQFCSSGPFFEGRRVEFTLRTLIPIFACETSVTQDVTIHSRKKPDGKTETWAECS